MVAPHFVNRDKCPACGSSNFIIIYQKPFKDHKLWDYIKSAFLIDSIDSEYFDGATYILCQCEVCALIFQKEILDDILMKRLYEYWIEFDKILDGHQKLTLSYYSWYAQEIMQIISWFNKIPSSLSFLDFGMGLGKWALIVKAFGCKSYGSEFSKICQDYAKFNGINIVSYDEIPQYQFDFINTEQVFEHIANPLQTLCHLKKGLSTNGVLKISVPSVNEIERRLKIQDWKSATKGTRNSLHHVAPLEHINLFKRESLIKMARIAGMKEVFLPIKIQYRYTTDWGEFKRTVKNIVLPIYRNIMKRQNYLFLKNN